MRHVTRDADDEWEVIEPDHIRVWAEAAASLGCKEYEHDGCIASVVVDWSTLVERLRHLYQLRRDAYSGHGAQPFDWSPFWEPLSVPATVDLNGKNELSGYSWYPAFFAELYSYELFTILNLTYPGSCNFLNLTIRAAKGEVVNQPRLSGYSFDFALVEKLYGRWPAVQTLPLEQVARWHSALRLGTKQIAETSVEKLLFAMLHLSRTDDYVEAVIWIFYALETLVETRVGESISTLVRRISSLLHLTEDQRSTLNKELRRLYDLRSAVVHGGYRVAHPIAQEVVDRRVGDDIGRAVNMFQFGFTIVVACVQALVAKNWVGVSFEEQIVGRDGEL